MELSKERCRILSHEDQEDELRLRSDALAPGHQAPSDRRGNILMSTSVAVRRKLRTSSVTLVSIEE